PGAAHSPGGRVLGSPTGCRTPAILRGILGSLLDVPVNPLAVARDTQQVHLALLVLAEGQERPTPILDRAVLHHPTLVVVVAQRPQLGRPKLRVQVVPLQLAQPAAAVDVTADYALADVVVILPDRLDELLARSLAAGAERVLPFAAVPAVVAAALDQV